MADNDGSEDNNKKMKKPPPVASAAAAAAAPSNDGDATLAQALQAVESLVQLFGFSYDAANEAVNAVGVDVTVCYNYILDNELGKDEGGAIYPMDPCVHVHQSLEQQQNLHLKSTTDGNISSNNNLISRLLLLSKKNDHQHVDDDTVRKDLFETPCMYRQQQQQQQQQQTMKKLPKNDSTMGRLKSDDNNHDESTSTSCPMGENWICLKCGLILCSRYINGHGVRHWEDHKGSQQQQQQQQQHCVAVSLADLSVWCHECQSYIKTEESPLRDLMTKLERIKFSSHHHKK